MNKIPKSFTPKQLLRTKFNQIPFGGDWERSFGQPQAEGIWFAWGGSGNGKTSFLLQLAKELSKHGKVIYNSLEEGVSLSMKEAIKTAGIVNNNRKIQLTSERLEDLSKRLDKPRSPKIVIIDSIQYLDINRSEYLEFRDKYIPKKLIIFTSHADGSRPEGRLASFVKFDASVKVWIEGYRAFVISRGFKTEPFDIWPEEALKYHAG